jgi:uncharacterized protein YodC (DUF2158 family)
MKRCTLFPGENMESSVDLKMGDVVMLKSGGPKMTIVNISSPLPGSISSAKWVRCIWFDGSNIYEYRFDSTVLVKASDRTSPPKSR